MRIKILIVCLIVGSFCCVNAESLHCRANFDKLNLSPTQRIELQKLDKRWENFNAKMQPAILKNKKGVSHAILDPNISESQLRNVYNQLIFNQNRVKHEAMEILIAKRRVLTAEQRKKGFKCEK